MTPEELIFRDANEALKKHDLPLARDLLTRLLKINRNNPKYWLMMSAAVPTKKERGYCLKEVLKLEPENVLAIHGLRLLGENIPYPEGTKFPEFQRIPWKTSLEAAEQKTITPLGKIRAKIVTYTILSIGVTGLIIGFTYWAVQPRYRPDTSPVRKWSITPPAAATIQVTPSPTFAGPPPLWTLLKNTFTPTPLYVVTPHNRSEAYSVAMKAYNAGDWPRALEYFKQTLSSEPNSPDIQYYIGEVYRQQASYKNATAAFDAAIKLDPSFAPAYMGKGRVYYQATPVKLNDAENNLKKALDLDPLLTEAMYDLFQVSMKKNDPPAASAWLDQIAESSPDTAYLEYARAEVYTLLGENKKALTSIKQAYKLDPSDLETYKLWGQILQLNFDYKASITPLNTYLTYATADPEGETLLARAYLETGDLELALSTINKVISTQKNSINAYVIRGEIYLAQENFKLAGNDFDNALRLNWKSFDANIGRGRTQLAQTLSGSAFEYFKTAQQNAVTETQKAVALYWRAAALVDLDEIRAAIRDFESFLAYPVDVVPPALREKALQEYTDIITPTPSLTPTITRTPTITFTPRLTPTPTLTVTPSPTRTVTPTRKPSPTPSE